MVGFTPIPENELLENSKPKRNPKIPIILLGTLLVAGIVSYFVNNREIKSMLAHKGFAPGIILRVIKASKSNPVEYVYSATIKGNTITGVESVPKGIIRDSLVGRAFPVIYDTSAKYSKYLPFQTHMLIVPGDFKLYNLPFPDSLKWVFNFNK